MPNIIGTTINKRYKVIESLGRGGMAEVFKVWDAQRHEHLAAKVLREDLAYDVVFLKRFEREARTLAKLQHPNIVRFYGLEKDNDLILMLMDYIEGESLRKMIYRARGKGINEKETLEIIQPIATALHYAHQQGVVHCDLKPGNILIDTAGKVFISDFGIARHIDAATMTLVGAGSPAYMAPELVRGQEPTPQSDIYSLGIVLYEMLTGGERPFIGDKATITGSTAEKVRWEQVQLSPESPRKYNRKISKEMDAVVMRCLEKEPSQRYASSSAFLEHLKHPDSAPPASAVKEKAKTTHKETGKSGTPIWQRWYLWAGLAAVAVVLFLTQITLPVVRISTPPTDTPPATAVPTRIPTLILTPTPTLSAGGEIVFEIDGMAMVYVPEGEFLRGSTEGDEYAYIDEFPQRSITLDAYWIDQTEVTNAQYKLCVDDQYCDLPKSTDYYDDTDYNNHPVVYVSWYDAETYCEWAGRTLPTEAEWEKAARGTDGRTYPWGESISCSQANYGNCTEFPRTSPIGYYGGAGASPYGALDMAGNVWEWVDDWYGNGYYGQSPVENPTGPDNGNNHIFRGGSWNLDGRYARSANRSYFPDETRTNVGFRCAISFDDLQLNKE